LQKFGKDVTEHWAFFVGQNAASEAIGANMRKVYEKEGFKVVYTCAVPPNDNNQTADVVQMQRAGVRAISWQGDLAGMTKLAAAMKQHRAWWCSSVAKKCRSKRHRKAAWRGSKAHTREG